MCKLRNTIDGAMSAIKIFITRVTKALVPQHSASSVLNGKDRDFQEGGRNNIVVVIAVVDEIAFVVVFVDVDVVVLERSMLKRRYRWCQCLDDGRSRN